ncbi:MAG: hypothetical protein JNK82_23430 [Myxococcaceae bacterium]|nr:hypothetical protein [Myxococcaceae bacterium]
MSPTTKWLCHTAVLLSVALSGAASAQDCEFSVCPPDRSFWTGGLDASGQPYATCRSCSWTYCSHTINRCPAGSTLDITNGVCTSDLCSGGCGGELPLCDADNQERYTGSSTDSSGNVTGTCTRGPFYLGGPISHQPKRCDDGWVLRTDTGMCFKPCLPDLIVRTAHLRNASGLVTSTVQAGRPYFVCAEVRNVGSVSAPGSILGGGGLGVPTPPTATVPALSAGASAVRCLSYASAPSPGTWRVVVTADSPNYVTEVTNANNGFTVTVVSVP